MEHSLSRATSKPPALPEHTGEVPRGTPVGQSGRREEKQEGRLTLGELRVDQSLERTDLTLWALGL